MRVLAVSVAPLFPDRIQGGSQRILMEAVDALAEAGHDVRVLSPGSGDGGFRTSHGAEIKPELELRGSFPAPYQTAPHRLMSVWRALAEGSAWADRAYLHADAVYMRSALGDIPVVRSLHDFVYEEALLSAFTLQADRTIVPSQYMRDCIAASVGSVTDPGEVKVVLNGIGSPDWSVEPVMPAGVMARQAGDLVLLHPHRPHSEKGIAESIRIAVRVQKLAPERQVRLLVPALQPGGTADDAVLADGSIQELAASEGASQLVELHKWLSPAQMPGYFAAGDVTLCPGSFVEAFGLTPLESVVAGTPAVCSKVGAFREQIGLSGITHFDYGDTSAAGEAVLRAVSVTEDLKDAADLISRKYNLGEMRRSYVEAITGPLPIVRSQDSLHKTTDSESTLKLAPWCYVSGEQIYHDYLARFESFPLLTAKLKDNESMVMQPSQAAETEATEMNKALKLGFIVPSQAT